MTGKVNIIGCSLAVAPVSGCDIQAAGKHLDTKWSSISRTAILAVSQSVGVKSSERKDDN